MARPARGSCRRGSPQGAHGSVLWGPKPGECPLEYSLAIMAKHDPELGSTVRAEVGKKRPAPAPGGEQPKDLWQCFSQAKVAQQRNVKELVRAEEELQAKEQALQRAKELRDRLLVEAYEANRQREKASEDYYRATTSGGQRAGTTAPSVLNFEVDPLLLQDLDDYEDCKVKEEIHAFRPKLEE
ncbi:unnamed protein product, partial [Prorocentrum cordatum]